jgi:hypothetical protein
MRSILKPTDGKIFRTAANALALLAITACGLCSSTPVQAQASWQWAKSSAGEPNTNVYATTTDAQGNVYITGDFAGGDLTLGTITLSPAVPAANTVFIAKYDKNGNVLWAKCFDQGFNAGSHAVATDNQGNVYIAGFFVSWITFGQTTLNSSGSGDIFIAKFNSAGNVLWSKSAGGTESDGATGLATDSDGNVVMSGSFAGPSLSFGNQTLNGGASGNLFLAKFNGSGAPVWLKGGTSAGTTDARSVVIDGSKNIYVTGSYAASLTLGTTTIPVTGGTDIFAAKLDQNGNTLWAKGFGGSSYDQARGIAIDAANNVYVCASFMGSLTFGTNTLTSAGNMDCLVAKFNATGQPAWAKSGGGEGTDDPAGIAVDKNGQVNVIGSYGMVNKTAVFNTTTLANAGLSDLFLARYDASGTLLFVYGLGGDQIESGSAIAADANANIYVAGSYTSPSVAFGTTTLTKPAGSGMLIYLAKYGTALTGIEQVKMKEDWSVYPNPGTGNFRISYPGKIKNVRVYNALGQELQNVVLTSGNELSLNGQPAGNYWLHLYTEEGYGLRQISIVP